MTLYLLAIVMINPVKAAADCASRVAPGLDLRENTRILRHCKLHIPGPAAASLRIYDQGCRSRRTSPGALLQSCTRSSHCGRARRRTGAAAPRDTCAASPSGHSSASGARSWAHVGEMMSRAATLPGAAARSPRAAETDPHFTKLRPWRPRAGGTAPGERQGMHKLFKHVFKLNADAPAPGTTGPRPAEGLACARRRTGARASARKTLAKQASSSTSFF